MQPLMFKIIAAINVKTLTKYKCDMGVGVVKRKENKIKLADIKMEHTLSRIDEIVTNTWKLKQNKIALATKEETCDKDKSKYDT